MGGNGWEWWVMVGKGEKCLGILGNFGGWLGMVEIGEEWVGMVGN